MAKEKIRCKKCRKSFDPELYSGLCPKCGAYNGRHMDNSALELYISGHDQGEMAHRELHEKYDQGYDAAHPKYDDNKRKKVGKSPFAKMIKALLITVIIMVIMTVIMVLYTNIAFMGKTEANIIEVISSVEPGKVIFDHVLLESPIEVSIKSAGIVEEIEDLSGKSIYVVTAGGGSEEYNYDARMHDVFLQYEFEGNIYYEMPMSSYNL